MADPQNPYEAPSSKLVTDQDFEEGSLLDQPRKLPAGRGLTWLVDAWGYFKQSPLNWVLIFLILIAIAFFLSLIPVLGGIALYVLYPVLTAGILLACRDQDAGKMVAIETLFSGFSSPQRNKLLIVGGLYMVAIIGISIVMVVLMLAFFGISGFGDAAMNDTPAPLDLFPEGAGIGAMLVPLFVMLLIIPIMMAFYFAPALILFHDLQVADALKRSFDGCLKNILPFLLFGVVILILSMLSLITFGLAYLVLVPVLMITLYICYKDIFLSQ